VNPEPCLRGGRAIGALSGALLATSLAACGAPMDSATPHSPALPASGPPGPALASARDPHAKPPPSGITPDAPFPAIVHRELKNGLRLRIVARGELPIVELRLIVLSGQASDGGKTGLAALSGELLKAGGAGNFASRELVEQAEALGSRLEVATERDATRISMAVTLGDLERALALIGSVAQRPRFDAGEFGKLRDREVERVSSLARTSATWTGSMLLYRELYELPTASHPYASYDATPAELGRIGLLDCKRWHATHFTPKNALLVVSGAVAPDTAQAAAELVFSGWKGEAPAAPTFSSPLPPDRTRVFVADRPGSAQSQIYLATLGPERKGPEWASLRVTNQILGGGVSGRLFLDVREKRSLAYSTGSSVEEPANGPVPVVLSAGTQTPRTGHAVQALREHFERLGASAASEDEVEAASRYLADSFLIHSASVGQIGELTARLGVLGLPDDWYDEYRKQVREIDPAAVRALASRYFRPGRVLIVVAGDAAQIAGPLRRFGQVTVVDPEQGFVTKQTRSHDPSVSLE
jgi:zinc protease